DRHLERARAKTPRRALAVHDARVERAALDLDAGAAPGHVFDASARAAFELDVRPLREVEDELFARRGGEPLADLAALACHGERRRRRPELGSAGDERDGRRRGDRRADPDHAFLLRYDGPLRLEHALSAALSIDQRFLRVVRLDPRIHQSLTALIRRHVASSLRATSPA